MVTRLETLDGARMSAPAATSAPFETIEILTRVEDAREAWEELYPLAPVSAYQSYLFQSFWLETIGQDERLEPFMLLARDGAGRPRALLPLAIETRAGLRIAAFLGGRESNFNLALLHPSAHFDEKTLRALLVAGARRARRGPDIIYLRNQPKQFDGVANPLAFKAARPSASYAFGTTLPATAEELAARFSKDSRKKLRKKEARLAEMGALAYEHGATGARAEAIVEALIEQKTVRFIDMGVEGVFEREGARRMLRRLSRETGDGAMEIHGLSVGGRVVATYAGVVRGGRFSAMLNSFDMDEEIARCSPGELLLHALMRNLVERGMTHFDLGAGEARYKSAVCDETIELCDLVLPVSPRGAVAAPLFSAYLRLKRRVKQSPRLARAYVRFRRAMRERK